MTNDLRHGVGQHKTGTAGSFTAKYRINRLVYYETFDGPTKAIEREKQLKGWRREKKVALIEQMNPEWDDLAPWL